MYIHLFNGIVIYRNLELDLGNISLVKLLHFLKNNTGAQYNKGF